MSLSGRLAMAHEHQSQQACFGGSGKSAYFAFIHQLRIAPVARISASQISEFAPKVSPVIPPIRRIQIRAFQAEEMSVTSANALPRRQPARNANAMAVLLLTS